jgi:hypothetical protein
MENLMKTKLYEIIEVLGESPTLFICSSSYEDRCLSVAQNLNPGEVEQVIILENEDFLRFIEKNSLILKERFGAKARNISLRTDAPLQVADTLRKEVLPLIEKCSGLCLIDITTFTHEHLLILIKMIADLHIRAKIKLVYAGVEKYSFNTSLNEEWLSKGLVEARSILGFSGIMLPSRKLHLIVLVGFEYERAEKLIECYEPALLSLGQGNKEDAVNSEHYERNAVFHKRVKEFAEALSISMYSVQQFEFSCTNPVKSMNEILLQVEKFEDFNIALCPMNTKLSTIGAALAALKNERIQLVYAQPVEYNIAGYSTPGSTCTIFDLMSYMQV